MPARTQSHTEKELSQFIVRLAVEGKPQTVEIHEVDMCGWRLFECFLFPAQTVVYISWDEEAQQPEWVDMEDEGAAVFAQPLVDAICQYRQKRNAA